MRQTQLILIFILMYALPNASAQQAFYESRTARLQEVAPAVKSKKVFHSEDFRWILGDVFKGELEPSHRTSSSVKLQHRLQGRDVFMSTLKVILDEQGQPSKVINNLIEGYAMASGNFPSILEVSPVIEKEGKLKVDFSEEIWFVYEGKLLPCLLLYLSDDEGSSEMRVWGMDKWMFIHDRVIYHKSPGHKHEMNLQSVQMRVFNPNPLTTSKEEYQVNSPYSNSYLGESDIPELAAETSLLSAAATFDDNLYHLRNEYVEIADATSPFVNPATSSSGVFEYNRSQYEFTHTNIFYHISKFRDFLALNGREEDVKYPIRVDPNATFSSGDHDQSSFTPPFSLSNPTAALLKFGIGGVPDGEDADVVIHEYCHALSNWLSFGTNFGRERQAIDEGLCDYFAASYRRKIDDHNWERVFPWDGWNEFWSGRSAISDKCYTNLDLSAPGTRIYDHTDLFVAPLMDLYGSLGAEVSDNLVLKSMEMLAINLTYPQFAELMLEADTLLYDGQYSKSIVLAYDNYCILNEADFELDDNLLPAEFNVILLEDTEAFQSGEELSIRFLDEFKGTMQLIGLDGRLAHETKLDVLRGDRYLLQGYALQKGVYILTLQGTLIYSQKIIR